MLPSANRQPDLTIRLPIVLTHASVLALATYCTGVDAKTLAKGALTPLLWITVRASASDSRELIPEAREIQPKSGTSCQIRKLEAPLGRW